jgi:hypothetical protein
VLCFLHKIKVMVMFICLLSKSISWLCASIAMCKSESKKISFIVFQAQARCHRIGQMKAVKVYRLITRNTYEREMFDKASLKLGLDKAVLQSMGNKEMNVVSNLRSSV